MPDSNFGGRRASNEAEGRGLRSQGAHRVFAKGWLTNAFTISEHVRPPFSIGSFLVYSFGLLAGEVFKKYEKSLMQA